MDDDEEEEVQELPQVGEEGGGEEEGSGGFAPGLRREGTQKGGRMCREAKPHRREDE